MSVSVARKETACDWLIIRNAAACALRELSNHSDRSILQTHTTVHDFSVVFFSSKSLSGKAQRGNWSITSNPEKTGNGPPAGPIWQLWCGIGQKRRKIIALQRSWEVCTSRPRTYPWNRDLTKGQRKTHVKERHRAAQCYLWGTDIKEKKKQMESSCSFHTLRSDIPLLQSKEVEIEGSNSNKKSGTRMATVLHCHTPPTTSESGTIFLGDMVGEGCKVIRKSCIFPRPSHSMITTRLYLFLSSDFSYSVERWVVL